MIQTNSNDYKQVQTLLGREPKGLQEVYRNNKGEITVVRVNSLVSKKPFPTLFWLVHKELKKKIDQIEAVGVISQLEQEVERNQKLKKSLIEDNLRYVELRNEYMDKETEKALKELNFYDHLQSIGIGGIADFTKIRCLHMNYAFHLVHTSTIGNIIKERFLS